MSRRGGMDSALLKLPVGIARWVFTRHALTATVADGPPLSSLPFATAGRRGRHAAQLPSVDVHPVLNPRALLWRGGSRLSERDGTRS